MNKIEVGDDLTKRINHIVQCAKDNVSDVVHRNELSDSLKKKKKLAGKQAGKVLKKVLEEGA